MSGRIETDMRWDGQQWIVTLLMDGRAVCAMTLLMDGRAVCAMTLDEWTRLSATRWAVNEALEARAAGSNRIGG